MGQIIDMASSYVALILSSKVLVTSAVSISVVFDLESVGLFRLSEELIWVSSWVEVVGWV